MAEAEHDELSPAGWDWRATGRSCIPSGCSSNRRPYDQLIASVAYPRRKVRLMGFLPGITTPGGMTHQAIEDVAVMRSIPNMTVLETGDATEVESICAAADSIDGPVYCRVLRGSVPRLFDTPIRVGEMRELALGEDVLVVTSGIATEEALRCRAALEGRAGVGVRHLQHPHDQALRPGGLPRPCDRGLEGGRGAGEPRHRRRGWGRWPRRSWRRAGTAKRLVRLGLRDTFAHGGSRGYLMKHYGLDATAPPAGDRGPAGRDDRDHRGGYLPGRGSRRCIPRSRQRRSEVERFRVTYRRSGGHPPRGGAGAGRGHRARTDGGGAPGRGARGADPRPGSSAGWRAWCPPEGHSKR